ncbi:MAG TPA: rhodanese-like domain-containing protein [Vicinamibacterales bacterium]
MTSGKVVTTIGYERRNNPALRFTDRAAFIRFMNADQPVRPANIANIVAINQGVRPLTMGEPTAEALAPADVERMRQEGVLVIDTRSSAAFGAAHIPGALNIQLTAPEFEQRVGWITPLDVPLALVVAQDELVARAMHALAFLGLDRRVKGFLSGGIEAWTASGREVTRVPQITVEQLREQLASAHAPRLLDVREPSEWNAAHIDGSVLQSVRLLPQRIADLPFATSDSIAVICHSGARSSIASSVLRHHGFMNVANVTGGMVAWKDKGFPTVDAAGCSV